MGSNDCFTTMVVTTLSNATNATGPSELQQILTLTSQIVNITGLVVIMISMGCVIDFKDIKETFRHPVGFFIGMLSQFVLMPLIAFTLAIIMQLDTAWALSMLILGCCPGGTLSNVFTHWTQGDTCLSVSMTTVSTAVAIGMMPLNLFIYTRFWSGEGAVIPYVDIFTTLITIVIPVAFGVLLRHFKPKLAEFLSKIGGIVVFVIIILAFSLVFVLNPDFYKASWRLWICAFLLPIVGFSIGYGLAFLFKQPSAKCRAIAFETGSQNTAFALTITVLSFAGTEFFIEMFLYPVLYAIFIHVDSFAVLGVYWWYVRRWPASEPEDNVDVKPASELTGVVSQAYVPDQDEQEKKVKETGN